MSIGSTLAINIQPSDDAYGRFGFRTDSVARVVEEQVGGTPVTLTVTRDGGTFGNVSVYWEVDGPLGDISPIAGVVEFAEDQVEGELVVTVADDTVRCVRSVMCMDICLCVCSIRSIACSRVPLL